MLSQSDYNLKEGSSAIVMATWHIFDLFCAKVCLCHDIFITGFLESIERNAQMLYEMHPNRIVVYIWIDIGLALEVHEDFF